jgi:AraC family transcriptional regulator, transcriptional activator of pobA
MKELFKNDLEIYTEEDITQHLTIGRPYRPSQTSIWLIKEGSIEIRYKLMHYILKDSTILSVTAKNVYEFIKIASNTQLRVISINPHFRSVTAIKIRRYDYISFLNSSIKNHFKISSSEFMEFWNATELLRSRITAPKNAVRKEIIHHLFLTIIYLWADLSGKYKQIKIDELNRPDKLTLEFIDHVSIHLRSEKSVAFYANLSGISSKHLSETIKACSGFTAGELINQAILTEAKILLTNNLITIKQVAQELNFSDPYSFSKFFKRLTHMTPSAYRENM